MEVKRLVFEKNGKRYSIELGNDKVGAEIMEIDQDGHLQHTYAIANQILKNENGGYDITLFASKDGWDKHFPVKAIEN